MFRCEECGWETPYGRFVALELGCFECGGRLVSVKDDAHDHTSHEVEFPVSA